MTPFQFWGRRCWSCSSVLQRDRRAKYEFWVKTKWCSRRVKKTNFKSLNNHHEDELLELLNRKSSNSCLLPAPQQFQIDFFSYFWFSQESGIFSGWQVGAAGSLTWHSVILQSHVALTSIQVFSALPVEVRKPSQERCQCLTEFQKLYLHHHGSWLWKWVLITN